MKLSDSHGTKEKPEFLQLMYDDAAMMNMQLSPASQLCESRNQAKIKFSNHHSFSFRENLESSQSFGGRNLKMKSQ